MALNHRYERTDLAPILPCEKCLQYSRYKQLMDAAKEDLKNKKDGKWIFDGEYNWQHCAMELIERLACEIGIKYANRN